MYIYYVYTVFKNYILLMLQRVINENNYLFKYL